MSKTLKSWEDLKLLPESIDWNLDLSIETMPTRYRLSNIYHSYLYQHIFLKTYFKDSKTKAFLEQIEKEVHLHLCFNEEVSKEQLQQSVSREIADYQALWYWNKIELISKVDREHKMNIESKFFLHKGDFVPMALPNPMRKTLDGESASFLVARARPQKRPEPQTAPWHFFWDGLRKGVGPRLTSPPF